MMDAVIRPVFAAYAHTKVVEKLNAADIAYGNLNDVSGLATHSQLRRCETPTPSGAKRVVSPAAQRAGRDFIARETPALGEHTEAIKSEYR